LTGRKPSPAEIHQLFAALEQDLTARQRRRAEVLVLYAAGMEAAAIAQALACHVNTVYAAVHAFDCGGLACIHHRLRDGAPARMSTSQRAELCRLAALTPGEVGLPYGRWSLAKLRQYVLQHHLVQAISREHLRRVLKKKGSASGASSVNCAATTRVDWPYWRAFA
jgi:transposase